MEHTNLRMRVCIVLLGFLFLISGANHAFSEEQGVKNVISVNPLGLIFGVINGEYERVVSPDISVMGNVSYWAAGIGDWKWSALGLGGGAKKYMKPTAPEGFWLGGTGSILMLSAEYTYIGWVDWRLEKKTEKATSTFFSILGNAGYKWIFANQFTLEPLVGLGVIMGRLTIAGVNIPIAGTAVGIGVNAGYAF